MYMLVFCYSVLLSVNRFLYTLFYQTKSCGNESMTDLEYTHNLVIFDSYRCHVITINVINNLFIFRKIRRFCALVHLGPTQSGITAAHIRQVPSLLL